MVIRLSEFEMPTHLIRDEEKETETYAKFIAEPFERGFGHTLGNAIRRTLLSSIEGAAVTSIEVAGVMHEFDTIEGMVEDVTELILNIKNVLMVSHSREPKTLELEVERQGEVTAGDIKTDGTVEIMNPEHRIALLNKKVKLNIKMEVGVGRGYRPSERNKRDNQPIGVIPIDSIFTPVRRVAYHVEDTRVGQLYEYDKLILEIWTDGRISPADALMRAGNILKDHLNVFVEYDRQPLKIEEEEKEKLEKEKEKELERLLNLPINEIELSVRSANCIQSARIKTIRDLVQKTEPEMLKFRNFGKKSLNEIKNILAKMGLTLGMTLPELGDDNKASEPTE